MSCCCVCSLQPCGQLLGKGLPLGCRVCCVFLCFVTFPNVSWSTLELRAWLAPWNWFKPFSKIFYWPFQGGTSFVDHLCFSVLCLLCLCVRVCLFMPCGHLLGKGWPLGSRLWRLTVSLSLSHWYPGSCVVLNCINFWSLHPYLLLLFKTLVNVGLLPIFNWSSYNVATNFKPLAVHVPYSLTIPKFYWSCWNIQEQNDNFQTFYWTYCNIVV